MFQLLAELEPCRRPSSKHSIPNGIAVNEVICSLPQLIVEMAICKLVMARDPQLIGSNRRTIAEERLY
jgi:hypothetical protein